jgi:hypothetical protein
LGIYTTYEMIADCREGKAAGWIYFITEFAPIVRAVLAHYHPERSGEADLTGRVLAALRAPDAPLFAEGQPEREFVALLRQQVLAIVEKDRASKPADVPLDLETLGATLEPFTLVEKQVAWLETMRYSAAQTATMMKMDPATVEKIRERASEALRGRLDAWRRGMIAENGPLLRGAALAARTEQCQPPKTFLDWMDGRITWSRREDVERHVGGCWSCIDLFARMREVRALLLDRKPLSEEEAEPLRRALGLAAEKPPLWKRMTARGGGKG